MVSISRILVDYNDLIHSSFMNRLKWKLKRCEDVEKNDDWNIKYLKENFQQ